jgi:hypothetical protein
MCRLKGEDREKYRKINTVWRARNQPHDPNSTITHGLMQANKEIYLEASEVYYSNNTFAFGNKEYGSLHYENLLGLRASSTVILCLPLDTPLDNTQADISLLFFLQLTESWTDSTNQ